jgi:predicted RNA-binding Zn-ribbon protein involved in translation (DUF1610 family)
MPAKSKAQQKFMGMVYAAKKGEEPASPEVAKAAEGMSKKSARKFAKTKHKDLPEHTKKEDLQKEIVHILEGVLAPHEIMLLLEIDLPGELEKAYPSLKKGPKQQTTVDIPSGMPNKIDIKEIVEIIMKNLDPPEIERLIRLLGHLKRHPDMWQGVRPKHEDVAQIAGLIDEDPGPRRSEYGRKAPKPHEIEKSLAGGRKMRWKEHYPGTDDEPGLGSWEPEDERRKPPERRKGKGKEIKREISKGVKDPNIMKMLGSEDIAAIAAGISEDPNVTEDATGSGGVAAGGEPMTEAGTDGKHKCKLCGSECGPDKACDTEHCPNNREEGGPVTETKTVKEAYGSTRYCTRCNEKLETEMHGAKREWYCPNCGGEEYKTRSWDEPEPKPAYESVEIFCNVLFEDEAVREKDPAAIERGKKSGEARRKLKQSRGLLKGLAKFANVRQQMGKGRPGDEKLVQQWYDPYAKRKAKPKKEAVELGEAIESIREELFGDTKPNSLTARLQRQRIYLALEAAYERQPIAEAYMENKNMKSFKIINESAKGRLSRRMHRMLEVASNGRVLTEDDWSNRIGSENLVMAKQMGLLGAIEGKVLGEQEEEEEKKKGGEPIKEQPPFGGGEEEEEEETEEAPEEFGGEEEAGEGEFGAEEMAEEEEEVEPISMHELAKFLEVLKTNADENALAMIDQAIAYEEEMEGDEGEEGFADDIAGEMGEGEGEGEEGEGEIEDDEIVGEQDIPGPGNGTDEEEEPPMPGDEAPPMEEDCKPCGGFLVIENGKIYVEHEGQVVDESYVVLEAEKKGGWPKKLKKGRFTSYCKGEGFDGPSVECAKKAMDSSDESVRGMASFYMNTVKPGGKDASAAKGKED